MSEAFPTNRGLWPMYRLMAGAHRYAIDYIEQAPVIVLAAAGPLAALALPLGLTAARLHPKWA